MPKSEGKADVLAWICKAAAADVPESQRLEAFANVVHNYQGMAYGCAYAILGDFHLAEDVAQEAFLVAHQELKSLRDPNAFGGWLRRIVTNCCHNVIRHRKNSEIALDSLGEWPARKGEGGDEDTHGQATAALRSLPEDQRMVMSLYYVDGYSQQDIAEFLEVSPGAVRTRLSRSRNQLRKSGLGGVQKMMKASPLPEDFADLIIRKVGSSADLAQARALLSYICTIQPDDFVSPGNADKAGIFMVGDEGDVQGAGYYNEVPLTIGSAVLNTVRAREIGGESRGIPQDTFLRSYEALFTLARQKQIHLATVHGSQYDHTFCGFVPSFYYSLAMLPTQRAKTIRTLAVIEPADEEHRQAAERAFLEDPHGVKLHPPMTRGDILVVRQGGLVTGYVRVNSRVTRSDCQDLSDRPRLHTLVNHITVRTRDAALAVIRLAGEITEKSGRNTVCLMQSPLSLVTQTMLSLGATCTLRRTCNLPGLGAQMVLILDLPGLSRQLESEFQARLARSPVGHSEAAFSLQLDGRTVSFCARGGRLSIGDQAQEIHRQLPRWVLTRLFVGYYSGEEVLAMGPIPWDRSDGIVPDNLELDNVPLTLPPPEAMLFAALFPKLWPCSWPDMDVWSWLLGEEHPDYYFSSQNLLSDADKARIQLLRFPWLEY